MKIIPGLSDPINQVCHNTWVIAVLRKNIDIAGFSRYLQKINSSSHCREYKINFVISRKRGVDT